MKKSTKKCYKCQEDKPVEAFNKDKTKSDGLAGSCKLCKKAYTQSPAGKFVEIKRKAKARNIIFTISLEYYQDNFLNRECFYCGDKLCYAAGLDRIDSQKGYEVGNLVACCEDCNTSKLDLTETEFYQHLLQIMSHTQKLRPDFWQEQEEIFKKSTKEE